MIRTNLHKMRELLRNAQAAWKGCHFAHHHHRVLRLFYLRSVEQARKNGHDANTKSPQCAGQRQCHSRDPGHGAGVGHLSSGSVYCRYTTVLWDPGSLPGSVDDNAPLTILFPYILCHLLGHETYHVEIANDIAFNDTSERGQGVRV